jgi:glycosyltransferase involved in cell wall biosynthesis
MPLPQNPKVSVLMLTYNHERFVAQAIESAVTQETNFGYEIVIGEDCSTDRTGEIVREFQSAYPDKIRMLSDDRNLGMVRNHSRTLQACKGEYVAALEGDDFWTHPGKLQKQADFLDHHADYAICFHDVLAFADDGSEPPWSFCSPSQKQTSTIEDLLVTNFIPTCSVMFRNHASNDPKAWAGGLKMLDWPLLILGAQRGLIGYLDETMAAYRQHAGGAYSPLTYIQRQLAFAEMYECLPADLQLRYAKIINDRLFRCWFALAVAYADANDAANTAKYTQKCLGHRPLTSHLMKKVKALLRLKTPRLFSLGVKVKSLNPGAPESISSVFNQSKAKSLDQRGTLERSPVWNRRGPA